MINYRLVCQRLTPALDPTLVNEAFKHVLSAPQQRPLLERFRYAFVYKAQFRYLGESKRDGLRHALRVAMGAFAFQSDTVPQEHERLPLDRNFRRRLVRAANSLARDPNGLKPYVHLLEFGGGDRSEITSKVLEGHIVQALTQYSQDPHSGTSVDPW